MIEAVLSQSLDPNATVTPDQLCDLMEMFITDLHLRKVVGEFWMEVSAMCFKLVKLATTVSAEAGLSKVEGLTPETLKILESVIEVSLQEIMELRTKLMAKLALLKQCPNAGAKIH